MGQRSQIYVRYNEGKNIVAYHLQWNWGEYMINRVYQLLDYISKSVKGSYSCFLSNGYNWYKQDGKEILSALIQANLEIGSYVKGHDLVADKYEWDLRDKKMIIEEFQVNPDEQDNNDGFLVIDITETKKGDKIMPKVYASIWNGSYKKVSFEEYAREYKICDLDYDKRMLNEGKITQKDYEDEEKKWVKLIKKAQKLDKKYKTIDDERYSNIFNSYYKYEDNLTEKDMRYLDILQQMREKGLI